MKAAEQPAGDAWELAEKLYAAHCRYHGLGDGSRWNEEPATSRHSWVNTARAALAAATPGDGMLREALDKLVRNARLLQQNCVGCAQNHHGHDFAEQGMPGWLADTQQAIDEARTALEGTPK